MRETEVIALVFVIIGTILAFMGLLTVLQIVPITFFGITVGYELPFLKSGRLCFIAGVILIGVGAIISLVGEQKG